MRKVLLLIMVAFVSMALFGCGEREFAADGEYMAFEYKEVSRNNTADIVFVTVTIENDEIVGFNIDTLQSTRTNNGTEEEPDYVWQWNEKTKKELGDEYGMGNVSEVGEWDEQAAALEAFWLENGPEAVTVDGDGYVDNVAGVSMRDAYSALALEAIENAKAGKFTNFKVTRQDPSRNGMDIYMAEMVVAANGDIESLVIDVMQTTKDAVAGTFVFREQTKQELGYAYRMHGQRDLSEADYIQWLEDNNKLEWFEQVALITDDIIANGWRTTASTEVPAGVSISTDGYYTLLEGLFEMAAPAVE